MLWLLPWGQENRVRHLSWVTYTLMFINIAVFVWMVFGTETEFEQIFRQHGLMSDSWHWHQFITANFIHADIFHLIGNMLFLWLFGDSIEDALGSAGFTLLYFIGGSLGNLVYVANNNGFDIPSVGASGCIAAIAGAYGVMFYSTRVDIRLMLLVFTLTTFTVRAFWVVLFWFGLDMWRTIGSSGSMEAIGGVNYVVHGIGFMCGFFLGVFARMHGVMRRYERLKQGSAWFGYWPQRLEEKLPHSRYSKR
jgi:membrane associated rhomboid family serine protease